jgi:hypothetical protein
LVDIEHILRESRDLAASRHFPPFVGPERESTPLNATPYIAHLCEAGEAGFLSNRAAFLAELRVGLEQLRQLSARPVAALLGGSAIGGKPDPSDLDCVVFYEQLPGERIQAHALRGLQRALKQRRIDVRFVPMDGDPLILLKTVSFFSMLYSKNAGSAEIVRGLVLLDCREPVPTSSIRGHDPSDA